MFQDVTLVPVYNAKAPFDDTNSAPPNSKGIGTILHETKNVLKCVYDFAVLGGATGTIGLKDDLGNPAYLPANALIVAAFVDVVTAPTSGGSATIALKAEATADLLAATAIASVTGQLYGKVGGAVSGFVKTTAQRQVSTAIATAAVTGGKFNVFLEYVISN